ncbi:MAG: fatty acid desaturase [Fidelibacterota bacterium]|nr:MAG: fatty acid desaturase [Candidatus Neomarinimicrobiota bacterium]
MSDSAKGQRQPVPDATAWREIVARYQQPEPWRSWEQVMNSILPYILLWYLMYHSLEISYMLTLVLALPAAGFLVRIFIIFHDCCHGSFFASRRANAVLGFVTGVLTFTPYHFWRHEHAVHHATAGNLDRRGRGDVWTMTAKEYQGASRWERIKYRVYRNPLVMFTLGALYTFLISNRYVGRSARQVGRRERRSVMWTNLAIGGIIVVMSVTIGLKEYVLIQLPIILFGGAAGVWLFYVQHQFEGVYWERAENWDYASVGLKGSSFYKLPKVLQWFTGNIGFHHIHHLSPKIPNYRLEQCHRENALFQSVKPLTLTGSLKSLRLRLWDEEHQKLVGFGGVVQPTRT